MKRLLLSATALAVSLLFAVPAQADWEMLREQNATYTFHITQDGTMLLSDFLWEMNGGIYISEDHGATWKKTGAKDYNYSNFYEFGDYIYAIGYGCHIARSEDGGHTWDILYYGRALEEANVPHATPDNLEGSQVQAMALYNDKLFVADCNYGVLMSDDWGETWTITDYKSLSYEVDDGGKGDGTAIDFLYNLVVYNGKLMCTALYRCYEYLPATNKWKVIRNDSNVTAVWTILDGTLYVGRSIFNMSTEIPFLMKTTDLKTWKNTGRPSNTVDTNVRALYSDKDCLYAGLQNGGLYFSFDGGATWNCYNEGLPHRYENGKLTEEYQHLLRIISDDEYVYVAMYNEPWNESEHSSGVYRIARSELDAFRPEHINQTTNAVLSNNVDCYDLTGRRINASQPGVSIVGGKKVILK